jgi:hypothetical protein
MNGLLLVGSIRRRSARRLGWALDEAEGRPQYSRYRYILVFICRSIDRSIDLSIFFGFVYLFVYRIAALLSLTRYPIFWLVS